MPPTTLGAKARQILAACALPQDSETRLAHWKDLEAKYSAKAVQRKAEELAQRGYLATGMLSPKQFPLDRSWLTDKGRHALETPVMRA